MEKPKTRLKLPSITFIVCLVLAAFLWVITYISKDYTVTLDFTVSCTDLPQGIDSVKINDPKVRLVFRTRGTNYLSPNFSKKNRTIELPIKVLIENKQQNCYNYTFTRQELTHYLKSTNFYDDQFVGIESPEKMTIYLK